MLGNFSLCTVPFKTKVSFLNHHHHTYAERCQHQSIPSTSTQGSRVKRALEEDEPQVTPTSSNHATASSSGGSGDAMETSKEAGDADKRTKTETPEGGVPGSTKEPDLNFPLPEEKGPACLVKVRFETNLNIFAQILKMFY